MAITMTLPSGKKVNAEWKLTKKSEFLAIMERREPYKSMIPKKRKDVIDKDWEFFRKRRITEDENDTKNEGAN